MSELINLFNDEERRIFWTAVFFLFFTLLFEAYALNISYSDYFIRLFDTQETVFSITAIFCIVASFYLFYLFIVVALSSARFVKGICFLFFTAAIFVEYSYQKALGRFFDVFDYQNAVNVTTEQQITSIFLYFNVAAIVPCLIFLGCLIWVRCENNRQSRYKSLAVLGIFALFYLGLSRYESLLFERKFPASAFNAFCRTSSDYIFSDKNSNENLMSMVLGNNVSRRTVQKPALAENHRPANNIIFVVDESVTGTHLSLNGYYRQTTPFLERLSKQKVLHNWGIAAAASTGSRFSYNALITGLTPDDLPDEKNFKVNSYPTIFQYAKAMNYTTYYFDGQMENYWGGIADDKNYIDNCFGVKEIENDSLPGDWDIDNRIARRINKIIAGSTGNFIFVFKRGSHYAYHLNFPADETMWQPSYNAGNSYAMPPSDKIPEVTNAYDNSLRYNIDSFFKNLADDYSNIPNESVIVYTGDHGETLFADGKASHGGITKNEATVPLFIIGEINAKVDTAYKASHQNLYPTLLDLMSYPEELRERKNLVSLLKAKSADSKPRFFNPNLAERIPFD